MSGLLIIGGGGNGRVIADIASELGRWSRIAFLDDHRPSENEGSPWETVGTCASLKDVPGDFTAAIIGFGDNALRHSWIERIQGAALDLVTIVAPTAAVSAHARLGPGTVVMPQAAINVGAEIGSCGLINTAASVDHDCVLGDAVHVAPGAHIGGDVTIGDRAWIGLGAAVRHGVSIGNDVMVGAGAAVVSDLPDACTALGVPARF